MTSPNPDWLQLGMSLAGGLALLRDSRRHVARSPSP